MITLVLGGRRSGKSAWAEQLALESGKSTLIYLATCASSDSSMQARIEAHQSRRAEQECSWLLLEEATDLREALDSEFAQKPDSLILLDCITLWISNLMQIKNDADTKNEISLFCDLLNDFDKDLLLISNEVGLGVAPPTELGNRFIDLAGFANQELAKVADQVVFITAGLPLYLKKQAP